MKNKSGARLDEDTKIKNKARWCLSLLLINTGLEILANALRQEK